MKLRRRPGGQRYAVVIRDESDCWVTLCVECSPKGDIFILCPRRDPDFNLHTSYHHDGTVHIKTLNKKRGYRDEPILPQKRQPLNAAFSGCERLGPYYGHGTKSIGVVYDPKAFDGAVIVEPGILGRDDGSVVVDLVEPGYEPKTDPSAPQRGVFSRAGRPSVVITIHRANQDLVFLDWPHDFVMPLRVK